MPTDPLTPTERAELLRLSGEASALPWTHGLDLDPPDPGIEASGGGCVGHIQCHGNINTVVREREEFSHADAAYLVAAANSVPKLLAMLGAAETEHARSLENARSALRMMGDDAAAVDPVYSVCVMAVAGNAVVAERGRLRDALAVVVHSLRVAAAKEDDAPMSAAAHREEALRVAELVCDVPPEGVGTYTPGQAALRAEARKVVPDA